MLCLQRGPIGRPSSQPCCKHHYFTPPSLSLFLPLVLQKGQFTVATIRLHQAKKGKETGERDDPKERRGERKVEAERGRERQRAGKKSARAAHKLYTVRQKKGALQLLPKYAQCTGMQHGALGERNKDSTVSGSLSQCYHIRTSLAGKFLIYAVIFSLFFPSSSSRWYRQGFNIQMPMCAGVCVCVCVCVCVNRKKRPALCMWQCVFVVKH